MHISSVARLSIGLVFLTMSLLYGASMVGLIPDQGKAVLEERKRTIESLGFCCSAAIQKEDISTILTSFDVLIMGNENILSAALRMADGTLLAGSKDHEAYWAGALPDKSTATHIRLPLYREEGLWGTVEMAFMPVDKGGIQGFFESTIVQLFLFFSFVGFIVYRLYLKRTLQHLDPSTVIPPRVKAALDTLSEGIVLMDMKERIVFANKMFAKKIDEPAAALLGRRTSSFDWSQSQDKGQTPDLPWISVLHKGKVHSGIRLGLAIENGKERTFMVSGAPIMTDKGKCRGVLATFNDVTRIEEQNEQMQIMIDKLEKSRDEVRSQNKKLEFYATRDPLTSCLNRRFFFEKLGRDLLEREALNQELCCIMLDIDHFKLVNDSFGHSVGDKVICAVSEEINQAVEGPDYVVRYGGEEFCIVLHDTGVEAAMEKAEMMRRKVSARVVSGVSVTVSMGLTSTVFGSSESAEIVQQADQALYHAKENGRNRVTLYKEVSVC